MASAEIDRFVQTVVNDHGFATGIKSLDSHYALVRFASERGFQFSCSEWGRYWAMDCLQAPDDVLDQIHRADPLHWSWAFRQLSKWRALLMEGAESDGLLPPAQSASVGSAPNLSFATDSTPAVPSPITDAERDSALQSFIALVRQRSDLKDQVKSARDQDDVIALAQAEGFPIDSLTLLRSWSKVTDFTKPTWFGWFDD